MPIKKKTKSLKSRIAIQILFILNYLLYNLDILILQ